MKLCSRCETEKSPEEFQKDRTKKDGLATRCKQCVSEVRRARYAENPAPAKQQASKWYENNKSRHRANSQAWRAENGDRRKETDRANYKANAEYIRDKARERYSTNPEPQKEATKRWEKANPESRKVRDHRRRANKSSAFVEDVTVPGLRDRDGDDCYLCGLGLQFGDPSSVHIEHKIPLFRGGEHSYANTALAHAKCNTSKGTKTVEEYLAYLKTKEGYHVKAV